MFAALPVVVAALTSFAQPGSPSPALAGDDADAAVIAAEVLAGAEQVVAVHELAGAVAFDLIDGGQRWQLTVALDDDGAVIDTALGRIAGTTTTARGHQRRAPIRIARVDRIDRDGRGGVVLRDRSSRRGVVVRAS